MIRALLTRRPTETRADPFGAVIPSNSDSIGFLARTPDAAMRLAAVWRAHNLICDIVSTLPADEFAPSGEPVRPPSPLLRRPSNTMPLWSGWVRQIISSMLLHGNAYGLASTDTIEIIDPTAVTVTQTTSGLQFSVRGTELQRWPEGPLVHIPGLTRPGSPIGLSVLEYAADTIGVGRAATKFGLDFFASGGHPTAVLQTDQRLDGEDGAVVAQRIKERFVAATRGRGPAVLGAGLKFEAIQVRPEESQFLETIRANRTDIANFFGVPPELIGGGESGGSLTYANVEERTLNFLSFSIAPWVKRLEEALSRFVPGYIRLNLNALVRVDYLTRLRGYDIRIRQGSMSVNEVRALEDEHPIEGGDSFVWPPA